MNTRCRSPWALPALLLASALAQADDRCSGDHRDNPRWFDRAQGYFSMRACTPAVWFDRFFGDQREDDIASVFVRVIPTAEYSDRDQWSTRVPVKARVNLPNLENRFSLVFDDSGASGLPGDEAANTGRFAGGTSAMLRYLARLTDDSRTDIDVGLRSQLKFFARARYATRAELTPLTQTRFTQSFYFQDGEGFGETSQAELEYLPYEDVLVRWTTRATIAEHVNGLELVDGVRVFHQIDTDRAVSWGVSATTNSLPSWRSTSYYASVRYRRRIFRPWFFVEAEPFVAWDRSDHFDTNPGIVLRAEVWLGDTSRASSGIDVGRRDGGVARTAPVPASQVEPLGAPLPVPEDDAETGDASDAGPPVPEPEVPTNPTSDVPAAGPATSQ